MCQISFPSCASLPHRRACRSLSRPHAATNLPDTRRKVMALSASCSIMATDGGSSMFNRESQAARSPQRGRPSGLLACAAFVTVALIASFATMALASSLRGANGRVCLEHEVRRTDRGGRARPNAVRAASRDDASSPVQEQRMPEGLAAADGTLEQDQAHSRVRRARPSRDPAAQQRDPPGHARRPTAIPLLRRQRQGRRERREHPQLRRHVARDLVSDRRASGAGDDRNRASFPSPPTTPTPTPTTPNEKYGY